MKALPGALLLLAAMGGPAPAWAESPSAEAATTPAQAELERSWLVPAGAALFAVSIAVDTIGHRTIYRDAISGPEGLDDIRTLIAGGPGHLTPGGWLVLATPNARSQGAATLGRHWLGWDVPRHLMIFTPHSLAAAVRRLRASRYNGPARSRGRVACP